MGLMKVCLVAEDPHPTLPEVTGSGDMVLWSVTMRNLGGILEGPTTEVTVSCRSGQEGFGKTERPRGERTAHIQITLLAQCYW